MFTHESRRKIKVVANLIKSFLKNIDHPRKYRLTSNDVLGTTKSEARTII